MNYVRCASFSLPISSIFSLHTAHCCICVPIVCGWSSGVQCFKPEVEEWSADWVGYKHCADHDRVAGLCKTLLQWSHLTEQKRRLQLGRGFISRWIISQQTSINTKRTCLAPILVCKIKMDQKWLLILVIVVSCQSKLNLIIKYYLICFVLFLFIVYCSQTQNVFFFSHFIKSFRIHFRDFQRQNSKGRG